MNITDEVRVLKKSGVKKKKLHMKVVLKSFAYFAFGFLFGFSGLGENFSPFGAAFVASCRNDKMAIGALGASLGYIVSTSSVSSLRYVAAILAVIVITGALKPFKIIYENTATPVAVSFLCLLVTGLAVVFSKELSVTTLLVCFCESVIGGASAFLFIKSRTLLSIRGSIMSLTSKDATSLVISGMILLLSIKNVEIFSVYPAHIIAVFFILICACYGKEAGGAIVGICAGLVMSFKTGNVDLLGMYAFGGLLAGAFSDFGKLASLAAFSASCIGIAAFNNGIGSNTAVFIEIIVAGAAFLFIPKRLREKLDEILSPSVNSPIIDCVKANITKKLRNASDISTEICTSLNTVSDALVKNERADIMNIQKKTRERICGSCGLFEACWKENFEETTDCFNTLVTLKREGIYLDYKSVPEHFSSKCIRTEMVSSCVNKLYLEYKTKERAEARMNEIHTLASHQFINVSALLNSLCEKLDDEVLFDMDVAAKAKNAATLCGFSPSACCAVTDALNKMTIELTVKKPVGKFEVSTLSAQLEAVARRRFELPEITRTDETSVFTYREKADFRISSAGVQLLGSAEKYSGDTFSTFTDGDGVFYAVICDGMGTGLKAALSSNLAVSLLEKLLKAGFGVEAAIKTVNTSLISKSGDESSVTLDMTAIDTFTGHVEFYKCGAADTVVRKSGKILTVSVPSLPLGIISDIDYSFGTGTLSAGDLLLMASDGVRNEDLKEMLSELKAYDGKNQRRFTEELCENARRNQPERNDDMTVVTLYVTENE